MERFALVQHLVRFRLAGHDLPAFLPAELIRKDKCELASSQFQAQFDVSKLVNLCIALLD